MLIARASHERSDLDFSDNHVLELRTTVCRPLKHYAARTEFLNSTCA